jgi:hypothetical protein
MQDYAIFKLGLHQEFVGGEMGSIGQFATAKFLNCRCRIRVKVGKARCEHMFSAVLPKADIPADTWLGAIERLSGGIPARDCDQSRSAICEAVSLPARVRQRAEVDLEAAPRSGSG